MNRIHIFNCSNDMALASGLSQYQPPKQIFQMEKALDFLPYWWAEDGDAIIVNDPDAAKRFAMSLKCSERNIHIIGWDEGFKHLKSISDVQYVPSPWGWSKAIASRLRRWGLPEEVMPDNSTLDKMRTLSSRTYAVEVLKKLNVEKPILHQTETPPMDVCISIDDILTFVIKSPWPSILKSPWSSSGRGILAVENGRNDSVEKWCKGVLSHQGCVIVDRFYDKALDFALEFNVCKNGSTEFLGYSIFNAAVSGQYAGNIVAPQSTLQKMLYDAGLCNETLQHLISFYTKEFSNTMSPVYTGPVGVDMIICKGEKPTIHPCIEINMRMNMGIAAIQLAKRFPSPIGNTLILTPPDISSVFNASICNGRLSMFAQHKL